MKYSIIIPYRNREEHLEVLLPRLQDKFADKDYEIIISEQGNEDNFQIAIVNNIGFKEATGDVIILHQVDYYPADDLDYTFTGTVTLMGAKAFFLDKDNASLRPEHDIPAAADSWVSIEMTLAASGSAGSSFASTRRPVSSSVNWRRPLAVVASARVSS